MSKFPPSVPIPESVNEMRMQRRRQMMVTARRGVMLRSAIIIAEIFGFVFLNSSALLLDALSSLVDIAASLFLIFCIKLADKPPDKNHPFGHGKIRARRRPSVGATIGSNRWWDARPADFCDLCCAHWKDHPALHLVDPFGRCDPFGNFLPTP